MNDATVDKGVKYYHEDEYKKLEARLKQWEDEDVHEAMKCHKSNEDFEKLEEKNKILYQMCKDKDKHYKKLEAKSSACNRLNELIKDAFEARIAALREVLEKIKKNSCCDVCQCSACDAKEGLEADTKGEDK